MDTDRDLVAALRRRAPDAFDELYRRYHARVWAFLSRVAGANAEDLFQDTWIAAARHAHQLREDTTLLPWLYTIAHNKHRNAQRAFVADGRRVEALRTAPQADVPVDEAADAHRQAVRAQAAFGRLPAGHREILVLCLSEGLDGATAGQVLGIGAAAARKRLSRARAELARLMNLPPAEGDMA